METINNIELGDENIYPDEKVLKIVLGASYDSYQDLLFLYNKFGMTYEWRDYRDGKAWLCIFEVRGKNILNDIEKVINFKMGKI